MDNLKFEELLGQHISLAEQVIGSSFEIKNYNQDDSSIRYYYNKNVIIDKNFYGIKYGYVYINTNENGIIQSISIYFNRIIDRKFYSAFNKVYDIPNSIQVIEGKHLINKTLRKDKDGRVIQEIKESRLNLREGSFDENPLYITWCKANYEIKALLKNENSNILRFTKSN